MTSLPDLQRLIFLLSIGIPFFLFQTGLTAQSSDGPDYSQESLNKRIDEAQDYRFLEKKPIKALKICLELLRDEKHFLTDSLVRFRLYTTASQTFSDLGLTEEKGYYLKLSYRINSGNQYYEPLQEYYLLSDLAGHYMNEGQPDSALIFYRLAKEQIFTQQGVTKYSQQLASLNNLGMLFSNQGNLDSAGFYYHQALEGYMDSVYLDTGLWLAINDNIALNNIEQENYTKAEELYDQNLSLTKAYKWGVAHKGQKRWIKTLLGKVNVLELQGREKEALEAMVGLENELSRSKVPVPLPYTIRIHRKFRELYVATGQVQLALEHSQKENQVQEALFSKNQMEHNDALRAMAEFNVDMLEERLNIEQEEAAIKLELAKTQSRIRFLIILLAALLIIGTMTILLIRRRRIQAYKEEKHRVQKALANAEIRQKELAKEKLTLEVKNEQNEKSRIQLELNYKQKDLETLALDITRNNEWTRRLLDFTRSLKSMKEVERLLSLSNLESEIRNQLRTADRQQKFQEKVDLVNHEFYQTLGDRFPSITSAEKELCGFIRMKLTNYEIATLRNISDASVRTARYRLRKKMALTKDQDLDSFIENLTGGSIPGTDNT